MQLFHHNLFLYLKKLIVFSLIYILPINKKININKLLNLKLMIKNKIIIGSRGSKLAILYAEKAKKTILNNHTDLNIDIKIIKTSGDIHHSKSLSEIGGKGLFSKQIEEELLDQKIDIAVHALKDLPSDETDGLETKIFLKRNDPRDVFISLKL